MCSKFQFSHEASKTHNYMLSLLQYSIATGEKNIRVLRSCHAGAVKALTQILKKEGMELIGTVSRKMNI